MVPALLIATQVFGQTEVAPIQTQPVLIVPGLGEVHHTISTASAEAQKFFDQGLAYIYAFNHEEALRSFQHAAEIDPHSAMAYWGVALALGPDINTANDPKRDTAAYEAVQKARSFEKGGSDEERGFIAALAMRYSTDPRVDRRKLIHDYRNAMGALAKLYRDDPDAATLYAESGMLDLGGAFWNKDGTPAPGIQEIVTTLESVLRRHPMHVGANHFYIHAIEGSPHPELGLASAMRLTTLAPSAGHLVHMPAHIFLRTGDYEAAARSSEAAAAVDRAYLRRTGYESEYALMYYTHNLHFMAAAYAMEGRFSDAKKAADELELYLAPRVKKMPMLEDFMGTTCFVLLRFHQWDEILNLPAPASGGDYASSVSHFARGLAYCAKGAVDSAKPELRSLRDAKKHKGFLSLGITVLAARIAIREGDQKAGHELLKKGVSMEDSYPYMEPPGWWFPIREMLGGLLFREGHFVQAEQTFRADLEKHPRSGRSLLGLFRSLEAEGNISAAESVRQEYEQAWQRADVSIAVEDY